MAFRVFRKPCALLGGWRGGGGRGMASAHGGSNLSPAAEQHTGPRPAEASGWLNIFAFKGVVAQGLGYMRPHGNKSLGLKWAHKGI